MWRPAARITVVLFGVGWLLSASPGQADTCRLASEHGGLTFPVEQVAPDWTCRVQGILDSATTVSHVGPLRVDMSETLYRYLLDHPPFAAALIRRLDLGSYRSEYRGPGRFWGDDGAGTKGMVQLLYEDETSRIYYLEGAHESRVLPHVSGQAVVFLRMGKVISTDGKDMMDSTMVAYTKLDNRLLAKIVWLLHPVVTAMVKGKLQQGVDTVHRLGLTMRQQPDRMLRKAMAAPPLPEDEVTFLREALEQWQSPSGTGRRDIPAP
jgi:hypothetical protein